MKKSRSPKAKRGKLIQSRPKVRPATKIKQAALRLKSATSETNYEEARREVRRMGLNPAKIEHHSLVPVEFHGRVLTIYEPLAREVREYCRAKKISVRDFVLQLMSGQRDRKGPASGDKTATVKKPQRARPGRKRDEHNTQATAGQEGLGKPR